MAVVVFEKNLPTTPSIEGSPAFSLTTFADDTDIAGWLALRAAAFANVTPRIGDWSQSDFHREFTSKPWWNPEFFWLARPADLADSEQIAGSVCLALRRNAGQIRAAAHWLAVRPEFRRKGLARLLMLTIENAALDAGATWVEVETHSGWTEAVAFYRKLGYAPRGGRRDA